jgi:hypothetical protein
MSAATPTYRVDQARRQDTCIRLPRR